ncbi:hypothetical protein ABZ490_29665 [Streptomyces sp. NPDC005811]|uniref:hypothetical protein n=1 Tax=Streptomyces sp. NPDC005811 TaxID=3154565 RepID=UPI0033DEE0C5
MNVPRYRPYRVPHDFAWVDRPPGRAGTGDAVVVSIGDDLRLFQADQQFSNLPQSTPAGDSLFRLFLFRTGMPGAAVGVSNTLVLPRSKRWDEAMETALMGSWTDPLWEGGHLTHTAVSTLRSEARTVHRQLVPLWRRRTRHGRVLSLDADLGGLSLYDLVAPDVDLLAHTTGGVFEDERLTRVLRGLDPAERAVVFAYSEGEGTTWTEAAAHAGATAPEAFGERVRRKTKRLAAEQLRRTEQHRSGVATMVPR